MGGVCSKPKKGVSDPLLSDEVDGKSQALRVVGDGVVTCGRETFGEAAVKLPLYCNFSVTIC